MSSADGSADQRTGAGLGPVLRGPARPAAVAVVLLTLCACATTRSGLTHASAAQANMPCSEAVRVASGALLRLGYSPELIAAPRPGAPGKIVGHKNSGWSAATPEPGTEYTATVTVTCSNQGAEFDAVTDEGIPAALTFGPDFKAALDKVAARHVTRPRLNDQPETGLLIAVEPLRGADAAAEFGNDLSSSGITAVRVKIDNHTDRTYDFTTAGVQLVTQEGERIEPLADAQLAQLATSLHPILQKKRLGDATIAPQAVLSGFLYFPASAYRRATLVLVDQATEEEEGFSVEF